MSGESGTWYANASGGNRTYTYQWQFHTEISTTWSNVGTGGASYTRGSGLRSFYLRVIVTSNGVSYTFPAYYVYVEPADLMCGDVYC